MKSTIAGLVLQIALTPAPEPLPSVVMEGCGSTPEQAQAQAFRRAIEFHSGSVVVNEAHLQNNRLVKNETLDYSAGRIDRYKILNETETGTQKCVTAEIWVERNAIGHRIMGHNSSEQEFAGAAHSVQHGSLRQEQQSGNRLLAQVIRDYPERAYNIQQASYTLAQDTTGRSLLRLPYVVEWNPNFLKSADSVFRETLVPLTWHTAGQDMAMAVAVSHPTRGPLGTKNTYLVGHADRAQIIYQGFQTRPRLQLSLLDSQRRVVFESCWRLASDNQRGFITSSPEHVRLYGNYVERNTIELALPESVVKQLASVQTIDLRIVSEQKCS